MPVLYVCGDYTYPISPMLKVWDIEFHQWELDQTWDEILTTVARERETL